MTASRVHGASFAHSSLRLHCGENTKRKNRKNAGVGAADRKKMWISAFDDGCGMVLRECVCV